MASQEAHRRVPGADVIGSAAHVMVGAGVVEEERDRFFQRPGGHSRRRRAIRESPFQRRPAFEPELARERELHVPQARRRRSAGKDARESRTRGRVIRADSFEPPLGFFLEAVEREIECDESGHDLPPKMPEVR